MPQCSCCYSAAGHETDSKSSKKWTSEREDLSKLTLAVVAVEAGHFVARYSPLFHSEPGCWFAVRTLSIHFDFRSPWWKKGWRNRVTTPSLVKVRCPSHCSLSRPASFFRFFLGAENLFGVWSRQPVKKLLYLVDLFIMKLKTKFNNRWQQYLR